MQSIAQTADQYITELPANRFAAMTNLRNTILSNIPKGFVEEMSYGMIGYVVPHSLYPKGYHCNPQLPLPFVSIASQKNFIALYHMGIYADPTLLEWFVDEYPKYTKIKLDLGKSCIRFKNTDQIPFELIGMLIQKTTVKEWIVLYELTFHK